MGTCKTPGVVCSKAEMANQQTTYGKVAGENDQTLSFFNIPLSRKMLGNALQPYEDLFLKEFRRKGITNIEGFSKLYEKYQKGYGFSLYFGRWHGKPCIYELKVNSKHKTKLIPKIPPKYLKGSTRECYLPGDIIMIKEMKKRDAEAVIKSTIEDNTPGSLKLFRYLVSEGEQKKYKIGHLITDIQSKGDGSGTTTLQPVIFYSNLARPISYARPWWIKKEFMKYYSSDLNQAWMHSRNYEGPLNDFVLGFTRFVAEYGLAAVKHLSAKVIGKLLGNYVEKRIKSKIRRRLVKGLPKASLSFTTTFVKEFEKNIGQQSVTQALNNRAILEKAVLKGTGAFLNTILSELSGEGLKALMPDKVVQGFGETLGKWLIGKYATLLITMTTKLFDLHADKIDTKTGRVTQKFDNKAMANYTDSLKDIFLGVVQELGNSLSEYALG